MIATHPIEIFPIEHDGFHLAINVKLNGKQARLLVDTGASKTVFDEQKLANFMSTEDFQQNDQLSTGLGTNDMPSKVAVIESLEIGTCNIKSMEVAVINLQHVHISYEQLELPPLDGVLGSDVLKEYNALIDYEREELTLKW